MARNRSHDGAHRTHCCWLHGCKYADDDCPVVTGEIEQEYSCEDCGRDGWEGIPPKEMKKINDEIGEQLQKWYEEEKPNDQKEVAEWIANKHDYRYTFWFVAKLAECNRIGHVWKFSQLYRDYRMRIQR
jgi:hypothetical protein